MLLMSIKTKYANEIFSGKKKYEFRRKSIGDKNCNKKIYIYSSENEKAIVGYIVVDRILKGDLDYILNETNYFDNKDIVDYFIGSKECFALHINNYYRFKNPIQLDEIRSVDNKFVIPQFYRYISEKEPLSGLLRFRE